MVEHHLAKVRVAGSSPVVRSETAIYEVVSRALTPRAGPPHLRADLDRDVPLLQADSLALRASISAGAVTIRTAKAGRPRTAPIQQQSLPDLPERVMCWLHHAHRPRGRPWATE